MTTLKWISCSFHPLQSPKYNLALNPHIIWTKCVSMRKCVCVRKGRGDKGDTGVADGLLELVWTAAVGLFLTLNQKDRRRPGRDAHHIWSPHLYWCLPTSQLANTHTHARTALISSDSAHIQLGPTVLVHVTDHKQNIHSSTGDTPQDMGRRYPRNTKRQGCGKDALQKCVWCLWWVSVCVCMGGF